jgi:hypothetical protein
MDQRSAEIAHHRSSARVTARLAFVETLRLFWNTRGAVDIAAVEHELSTMMGSAAAGPYCKNLDRVLRVLDHHFY